MLRKIAVSTISPTIPIERVKQRLIIDHDDWDQDIEALIRAASDVVERETGRVLQPSTWELRTDCWPGYCYPLRLDIAPIRDVLSVKYLDDDGLEQTVLSSNWYWDRTSAGADLRFITGYSFPLLYNRPGSVRVRVFAGYDDQEASGSGDDPELTLPPIIEMAVLFLVGAWMENRESVIDGQRFEVPQTFKFLADQLKIYR